MDLEQHPPERHDLIRAFVAGIKMHKVGSFAGPLALIRATERDGWKSAACLGWEDYVAETIELRWIKARHIDLVLNPEITPISGAENNAISRSTKN